MCRDVINFEEEKKGKKRKKIPSRCSNVEKKTHYREIETIDIMC